MRAQRRAFALFRVWIQIIDVVVCDSIIATEWILYLSIAGVEIVAIIIEIIRLEVMVCVDNLG